MTLLDDEEREEEREEELRLEDRLTLEEELPLLRDEETLEEEAELLRDDTDLELERDEREDELRDELRLTADDLDTGAVDLLLFTELAPPLLRREEERDEDELELLFLAEELCIVELIDLPKFEDREEAEAEFRLVIERLSTVILDGYVLEVDFLTCDFTSLEEAVLLRSGEDVAFERDKELFLEG